MSWFDTAGFASFAKSALSTAQKTIDKALEIQDDKSFSQPVANDLQKDDDNFFAAFGISNKKNAEKSESPTVVTEPVPSKNLEQTKSGMWGDWGSFSSFRSISDASANPEPKNTRLSEPELITESPETAVLLQPQSEKSIFPEEDIQRATELSLSRSTVESGHGLSSQKADNLSDHSEEEEMTVSFLLAEMAPKNLLKNIQRDGMTIRESEVVEGEKVASCDTDDNVHTDSSQPSAHFVEPNVHEQDLACSSSSNDLTLTEYSDGDASPGTMKCDVLDMSPTDYCIVDQPIGKHSSSNSPSLQDLEHSEISTSCSVSMEMIHQNDLPSEGLDASSLQNEESCVLSGQICETVEDVSEKRKGPTSLSIFEKENLSSQYSSPDSVIAVLDEVHSTLPSPYYPNIHIIPGNVSMHSSMDFASQQDVAFLSSPATGETPDSDQDIVAIQRVPKSEPEPSEECETSSSASKGSCASSGSFVNCSVEDADNCYRENSPSSTAASERSDAMRPGGEFSGHTSADEIETATSSDIEIISPPNGENGDRHPVSPMKHIWAPRPHRLRCSESPASDGIKDIMPVLHEREEVLRASASTGVSSQEIVDVMEGEEMLKRLVTIQELLEARESRVLELSKENIGLQEEISAMRSRIQRMEETHSKDSEDVSKLTKEFSQRLSQVEMSLREATLERDAYKQKLQEIQAESANRPSAAVMEVMMVEKDQQILELRREGEKLSKQQLQLSNIIKKLRSKEKESETQLTALKEKLEERSKELERLRKSLGAKDEQEKKHIDAIRHLTATTQKQEDKINTLQSELEDSKEELQSMKNAMEVAYKDRTEMQKTLANFEHKAQEDAISAQMAAKEEVRHQLQQAHGEAVREQETLLLQVSDLRQTLVGVEKQAQSREEALKLNIADLQKRLQESDSRHEELTKDVSFATRPLLRQIENLQNTYSINSALWEKTERNLLDRLNETQKQLSLLTEKERSSHDRTTEMFSRISALESEKRMWEQERSHLASQVDVLKAKIVVLEETKNRELKAQENLKMKFAEEITSLKHEKDALQQKINILSEQVENASKKEQQLEQELDMQQSVCSESERSSPTPSLTRSRMSSVSREGGSDNTGDHSSQFYSYDAWWNTGTTSTIENLQSHVKRKEGEINQLQAEISRLDKIRSTMEDELVALVRRNEQLEEDSQTSEGLKLRFTDLEQKYNTLLQMYGEKVEEAEELRLDLSDIKTMYRVQLDELMKKT